MCVISEQLELSSKLLMHNAEEISVLLPFCCHVKLEITSEAPVPVTRVLWSDLSISSKKCYQK